MTCSVETQLENPTPSEKITVLSLTEQLMNDD